MQTSNIPEIHAGAMVKNHIDTNHIFKSALARKLQRDDSAILRYQKSASLQTSLLLKISHALRHNFFADMAAQLPDTYSTSVAPDTGKDKRIAELEEQLKLLQAKYEAVVEVMKKG